MIRQLIEEAQQIQRQVNADCQQLALAREKQKDAARAHQLAKRDYEDAEGEFLYRLELSGAVNGGNADQRKAQRNALLIEARGNGSLSPADTRVGIAVNDLLTADLKFEQCKDRFIATRAVSELQAAMLMAVSGVKET